MKKYLFIRLGNPVGTRWTIIDEKKKFFLLGADTGRPGKKETTDRFGRVTEAGQDILVTRARASIAASWPGWQPSGHGRDS